MTKRVLMAAGLAAILVGGSVATAQSEQPAPGIHKRGGSGLGPRGDRPRGFAGDLGLRGIELTDAQREQVGKIMESHQAEFQQVGDKLRAAHRAFAEATRSEPVDEAAIRARSGDVAAAMADEAVLRAKVRAEVFGILTPEQVQKSKELRTTRQERRRR